MSINASTTASPSGDAVVASLPARKYRGAVIGLGGVARGSHIPGFLHDEATRNRLEIVATVDASPSAVPLDGVPQLESRDDLRLIEDVDFVDICTPTSSHLDLTIWALEHGYHVLCEKPVALTTAEARRIADASRESGRVVMPCHQYRYNPVWVQLRKWLAEGAIGRWHLAELHVYRLMADRGTSADSTPWRGLRADAGGGILLDHGTHLIYSMLDTAGVPPRVRAWTGLLQHQDYDVEDSAHLLFEYPQRLGVMFLTWAARHRETHIRFIGDGGSIDWIGGVLRLERGGAVEEFDYSAQLDKSAYPAWFAALFNAFANAMDANDLAPSLIDITNVAAVLEGAYESARSGAAQEIQQR
ncbi:MAG: Gfo/Idh/MocA family oxidoreductase [Gemmatimonadota bacterium]